MESVRASVSDGALINTGYLTDGSGKSGGEIPESKDLSDDLIHDLDSYLEDINERLIISRMVSDSIIKGMVNAISQESTEIVAAKELEVARLKEVLCNQRNRNSEIKSTFTSRNQGQDVKFLGFLNETIQEQMQTLGKCIASTKEISRNLKENSMLESDLEKAYNSLKTTLTVMCQQVDEFAYSPESSAEEWKVELNIHKEVEAMVFGTVIVGLRDDYEEQLWSVNNVLALIDKFNEIPGIRHQLDSILKCFVGHEVGNLSPQGSIEMDHFHRKVLPSTHLWDANHKHKESKYSMPDNLEISQLKHMSAGDLYQHFKTVITEMKRENESTVQQMTEEYFALKRELLKEREFVKEIGPFAALKKDKEFEIVRKKIPEVLVKLDDMVRDNEKLSKFCNHSRDTLDSLLGENRRLKEFLYKQKQEVHCLSLQTSDARKKLMEHSLAEENLHKMVKDLKLALQDQHIEASISEEVYKCVIRETTASVNSNLEDLDLKSVILEAVYGTIYEGALHAVDVVSKSDFEENLDMQSCLTQQIYEILFQEVVGKMSMELNELKDECSDSFKRRVSEIENELTMKVEENDKLRRNVLLLENSIKEYDKKVLDIRALHDKERAEFTEEHNKLSGKIRNQEVVISEKNGELVLLKNKMEDFQTKVEVLNKKLDLSEDKLRKFNEEKACFISIIEQNKNYTASIKAKDSEHIKHMESICHVIQDLSKFFGDFEHRFNKSIEWQYMRLENSSSLVHSLIPKINAFRRTGSLYKKRLDRRSSDLQKAEAEVDLLGDKVETLLSLLQKIYVALDHYSPILQYYPGIVEILMLVKRELRGETAKAV
ncbi:WPP domain-associated protein [Amaranthus tricolor]|uniref:WPP domain-associated protein n=1 Tax=Amaranthus tricolor TaxID=29722 RepID=UPI00258692EC|nr:WPP domain-associated protein [Amaranthus tricolor]